MVCLPSDFVANNQYVDFNDKTRYFYECPWSNAVKFSWEGGNASDTCPGGATEPCALLPYSCCAVLTKTVNGVLSNATNQVCMAKQYVNNWQIASNSTSPVPANLKVTVACLPKPPIENSNLRGSMLQLSLLCTLFGLFAIALFY